MEIKASDVVAGLALFLSGINFYFGFLQKSKINIVAGDSIDIVLDPEKSTFKLHIACFFTNSSQAAGTVNKVRVIARGPGVDNYMNWNLFYKYELGHRAVPDSKVHPIFVPGNGSSFTGIEFKSEKQIDWQVGRYSIEIRTWTEGKSFQKKHTAIDKFTITLSEEFVNDLYLRPVAQPQLRTVLIDGR